MLGATGSVGTTTLNALLKRTDITQLTLLGRRLIEDIKETHVQQHQVDITLPATYQQYLENHQVITRYFANNLAFTSPFTAWHLKAIPWHKSR